MTLNKAKRKRRDALIKKRVDDIIVECALNVNRRERSFLEHIAKKRDLTIDDVRRIHWLQEQGFPLLDYRAQHGNRLPYQIEGEKKAMAAKEEPCS
jgi:hypothetical protein